MRGRSSHGPRKASTTNVHRSRLLNFSSGWVRVAARPGRTEGGAMARTPLLRALQRLAAEHGEAARLGIEVEELRERVYSRRELLKRGAIATAAATVAPAALARSARA